MIFDCWSVWILPSLGPHRPRTVITVGRPSNAIANFSAKVRRTSSPDNVSNKARNAGPYVSSQMGKLPGVSIRG